MTKSNNELTSVVTLPVSERIRMILLPAALLVALLTGLSAPLTWFFLSYEEQRKEVETLAHHFSSELASLSRQSPELWVYNSGKIAQRMNLSSDSRRHLFVEVRDPQGRTVYKQQPGAGPYLWGTATLRRGSVDAGTVVVGISATGLLKKGLLLLLLFGTLGALLGVVVYVLPLSSLSRAEARLQDTLKQLESARKQLQQANEKLDERIKERTEQLERAYDVLAKQQKRLQELATKTVLAQEEERQRIARDLHDGAGQLITALRINLETFKTFLNTNGKMEPHSQFRTRLDSAIRLVDNLSDEIRVSINALRPPLLDQGGLKSAIEKLASQFHSDACKVRVDFTGLDDVRLPSAVEVTAFRLVQEGVTNALRHAGATSVQILVSKSHGNLRININDNGKGRDTGQKGVGLASMEERVTILSGQFGIEWDETSGTSINAVIPVE